MEEVRFMDVDVSRPSNSTLAATKSWSRLGLVLRHRRLNWNNDSPGSYSTLSYVQLDLFATTLPQSDNKRHTLLSNLSFVTFGQQPALLCPQHHTGVLSHIYRIFWTE